MDTMASPRFTMRLDPELKDWLESEAKRQDRSAAYLAKQAIQAMKDEAEAKSVETKATSGGYRETEHVNAYYEAAKF